MEDATGLLLEKRGGGQNLLAMKQMSNGKRTRLLHKEILSSVFLKVCEYYKLILYSWKVFVPRDLNLKP